MSREERRAYQRMMKKQDPYAPPPLPAGARIRAERQRATRRSSSAAAGTGSLLRGRATVWLIGGAFVTFLLGLSLMWPNGATISLLVGAATAVVWAVVVVGFLYWRRQAQASEAGRARGIR